MANRIREAWDRFCRSHYAPDDPAAPWNDPELNALDPTVWLRFCRSYYAPDDPAAPWNDPELKALLLKLSREELDATGIAPPGFEVRFKLPDDAIVPYALAGDVEPLISYIEKGGDLNRDDVRNFVLGVLQSGKVPRHRGEYERAATLLEHARIAYCFRKWLAKLGGAGKRGRVEAATTKVIEELGVDRSAVQRARKARPDI